MKRALVALLAVACLSILVLGVTRQFGKPHLSGGGSSFDGEDLVVSIEIAKEPWPAFWQPKREYRFKGHSGGSEAFLLEALYLANDPDPALICRTPGIQSGGGAVCVSKRGLEDSHLRDAMRADFDTRHIVTRELERLREEALHKMLLQLPSKHSVIA